MLVEITVVIKAGEKTTLALLFLGGALAPQAWWQLYR
jgi:hypothetical protein